MRALRLPTLTMDEYAKATTPSAVTLGPYRLGPVLGAGGFGKVFKAQDTRLDRAVAVKVIPSGSSPDARARVEREARVIAGLNHPHICTLFDVGTHDGELFLVLEFLEGETLASRLSRGPLPLEEAQIVAAQIAQALQAAHNVGIAHRDLKPANVMMTATGAKLLDFGLAKAYGTAGTPTEGGSALTSSGDMLGSLPYMAPEQFDGRDTGARIDVHAFGVMMFEVVSGHSPFLRSTPAATMAAIMSHVPPPLREVQPNTPEIIDAAVRICLAKEPQRRYADGSELASALAVGGRPAAIPSTSALRPRKPVIAVLPLANLSGEAQDYFASGLTDALIGALATTPRLQVISASSSSALRDRHLPPQEIGERLGATLLVEGSVQRLGEQIHLSLRLLDACANGRIVWAGNFDRAHADLLSVHYEVAETIAAQVVSRRSKRRAVKVTPRRLNVQSHESYLKGLYHWGRRTEDSQLTAIDFFNEAIAFDPTDARGYAGLADCYTVLSGSEFWPPRAGFPKAIAAAQHAVKLDASLSQPHAAIGMAKCFYDAQFAVAEQELRQAARLNPNSSTAHHWLGVVLLIVGRPAESIAEINIAGELDPLSPIIAVNAGRPLHMMRRYEEAIEYYQRALEIDRRFWLAHLFISWALGDLNRPDEALAAAERAVEYGDGHTTPIAALGEAFALTGNRDRAEQVVAQLIDVGRSRYVSAARIARIYSRLGEVEATFQWLRAAQEQRSLTGAAYIRLDPTFDPIRHDPRFAELLSEIGLGANE